VTGRPRTLVGDRAVLPALRVEAVLLEELKAEAAALGVPLPTYHRQVLVDRKARAKCATDPEPRAKSEPVKPARRGPRRCDCPRPRPKSTGYGLCTGCGGRR